MPTLRQLEYLVTLADEHSFVQAARIARISQPTLSQQIKALEDRLAAKLVERGSTGVILTPVGRAIVERARGILSEVRQIEMLAAQAGNQLSGTLRFGTTPTLGPYLLSPMIADLHRAAPDLRLYVREGIPEAQALELSRGNLDVLLGPLPIDGEDLHVEPLFREPLVLVAPADSPLAIAAPLPPERLSGAPLLSLDRRHHLHRQTADIAAQYGMRLTFDYEGTSLDSLRQMAASGLGLTVLPALYIASEAGGVAGVKVLDVAGWTAHRSIALAWRRNAGMAPAFRLIAEHVQQAARTRLGRS